MRPQLIVLAALCAAANGLAIYAVPSASLYRAYPFVYTAQSSSLVTPTQQQYLSQDELGQYAYGYAEPLSSKQESRSLDGITRGSYSYRDANGQHQLVDYTADAEGFHVAATNLPKEFRTASPASLPADTVDVAAARQSHLATHEETLLRLEQIRHDQLGSEPESESELESNTNVRLLELPSSVADTSEVAAAKSIHLERVQAETLRNELLGTRSPFLLTGSRVYSYNVPRYYTSGFYY